MTPSREKTNPRLTNLITTLKAASRENSAQVWRDIAVRLEGATNARAEVNVSKINRYASEGETILVPGKVLGSGAIDRSVRVAALNFSAQAADKITEAKGTCMTIEELLNDNPKGSRVRILR
ncbi:MAG: 50S ribosomal protein L18e [Methanospirillum sp.]|nr:50S ribosomal protein L18e [Methanospirillum sp.]